MIQRILRVLASLNLAIFLTIVVRTGSPIIHGRIGNLIQNWWFLSTLAIIVLLLIEVIVRAKRKIWKGFWLDAALFGAWLCAMALVAGVAASEFLGF